MNVHVMLISNESNQQDATLALSGLLLSRRNATCNAELLPVAHVVSEEEWSALVDDSPGKECVGF